MTTMGALRKEFPIRQVGQFRVCAVEAAKDFAFNEWAPLLLGFARLLARDVTETQFDVLTLLTDAGFFESKSDVRRAIKAGSLTLNKKQVKEFTQTINSDDLFVFGKGKNSWLFVTLEEQEL